MLLIVTAFVTSLAQPQFELLTMHESPPIIGEEVYEQFTSNKDVDVTTPTTINYYQDSVVINHQGNFQTYLFENPPLYVECLVNDNLMNRKDTLIFVEYFLQHKEFGGITLIMRRHYDQMQGVFFNNVKDQLWWNVYNDYVSLE